MMHLPVESFAFVLYLDSLFTENRTREVTPPRSLPETLNRLHLQAMREHARENALLYREHGKWQPTPDWRLDRHVIRTALYLRERLKVEPGQRVAVLAELRPEWLIADLAALGLGAVSVAIDPTLRGQTLDDALADAAPAVTFVTASARRVLETLDGRAPAHGQLIMLDPAAGGSGIPFTEVLEQGGTLDTPERAQACRSDARAFGPEHGAIRHYQRAPGGGWSVVELSQGDVIELLAAEWMREPARLGDVAYVSDPTVSLAARLALYAFLGDGYTTTAVASADQPLEELAAIRPTKLVASAALLANTIRAALVSTEVHLRTPGGWLRRARRIVPLGRARAERRAIRERLGGRVRWVRSLDSLDPVTAKRLGSVTAVVPITELNQEVPYGGAV